MTDISNVAKRGWSYPKHPCRIEVQSDEQTRSKKE